MGKGRSVDRTTCELTRHIGRDFEIEERWDRTKHGQLEDAYVKVAQRFQFVHSASGELRVGWREQRHVVAGIEYSRAEAGEGIDGVGICGGRV
jgi:hypothetical protein